MNYIIKKIERKVHFKKNFIEIIFFKKDIKFLYKKSIIIFKNYYLFVNFLIIIKNFLYENGIKFKK